jgi:Tannase and feruloyl esterase
LHSCRRSGGRPAGDDDSANWQSQRRTAGRFDRGGPRTRRGQHTFLLPRHRLDRHQSGYGKTANFGIALPVSVAWNNRFLQIGCGGLCGTVFATLPTPTGGGYAANALANGFAVAATDDGHASNPRGFPFDGSFGITAPGVPNTDAVTDYFYRAVHTLAAVGKQFVSSWYAGALSHSYFVGCSDGGRESMVEATNYPADFEGYVAGDPFFDVPGQTLTGKATLALLTSSSA